MRCVALRRGSGSCRFGKALVGVVVALLCGGVLGEETPLCPARANASVDNAPVLLVVDRSSSMRRKDRFQRFRETLHGVVAELAPTREILLLPFPAVTREQCVGKCHVDVPQLPVENVGALLATFDSLFEGGAPLARPDDCDCTPLWGALSRASLLAAERGAALVVFTDGEPYLGDNAEALARTDARSIDERAALAALRTVDERVIVVDVLADTRNTRNLNLIATKDGLADGRIVSLIDAPAQLPSLLAEEERPALDRPDVFEDVVAVGNEDGFGCSGVLLESDWVLTARHCLPVTRILVGDDVRATRTVIGVRQVVAHPSADAALVELDKRLLVRPRARRTKADVVEPQGVAKLVGFGAADRRGLSSGRRKVLDVPLFGWGCDARRARHLGCDAMTEMVLMAGGGRDSCRGDSGGPVYELVAEGDGESCSWRLLAITSRSIRGARVGCGDGGIYTRVDALASWVREVVTNQRQGDRQ